MLLGKSPREWVISSRLVAKKSAKAIVNVGEIENHRVQKSKDGNFISVS